MAIPATPPRNGQIRMHSELKDCKRQAGYNALTARPKNDYWHDLRAHINSNELPDVPYCYFNRADTNPGFLREVQELIEREYSDDEEEGEDLQKSSCFIDLIHSISDQIPTLQKYSHPDFPEYIFDETQITSSDHLIAAIDRYDLWLAAQHGKYLDMIQETELPEHRNEAVQSYRVELRSLMSNLDTNKLSVQLLNVDEPRLPDTIARLRQRINGCMLECCDLHEKGIE